jgi:pimeloyl-ACP methyl ester carboxylesterase
LDALRPGDVLVGHSSGAVVAILAANERPADISHLCVLAGILPVDGKPLPYETTSSNLGGETDWRPAEDTAALDTHMSLTEDGSAFYFSPTGALMSFYSDCTDELATWASERLVPEPLAPLSVPVHVPNFWQSDIPRSFIMCRQDPICFPELAHLQARRLGVVPIEMDSAHSPFISQPRELAGLLVEATRTKPVGPLIPHSISGSVPQAS